LQNEEQGKQMQLTQLRIMDARAPSKVLRIAKGFAIRKLGIGGEVTPSARLENIDQRLAERYNVTANNDCLGQQITV
jgi:hypothetical protein